MFMLGSASKNLVSVSVGDLDLLPHGILTYCWMLSGLEILFEETDCFLIMNLWIGWYKRSYLESFSPEMMSG